MKRIALFFSLLLLCLVLKADPVSRSQALKEAKSFLATKGIDLNSSEAAYRAPRKANAQESESSYYYIFNVGNDQGFVIVSGDDRTEQILGYSDTGDFDEENMPEPLKAWLEGYEKEMESIVEVDASEFASVSPKRAQEKTKKSIEPMTTSKWGAGHPYNEKTPTVSNGTKSKHAPVGCTGVALAQLMYYYKTVTKTIADINSSIPSGTKIDWNNMLDEYIYKGYTDTQKTAVSNLMIYCARALKANFTYSSTTASEKLIPSALSSFFGYKSRMTYVTNTYYSMDDWEDLIYNELLNKRPVAYTAWNNNGGGHVFVVDGYDSRGLFHINWGWRGKYNGFFCLSVLNRLTPGNVEIQELHSYAKNHSAILYVSPTTDVNTSNGQLSAIFTTTAAQSLTCKYENQSGISGTYYFGIGYLDSDGNVNLLKQYSTSGVSLASGSSQSKSYTFSTSDFSSLKLKTGTYTLVPIYKLSTDTKWNVCQYPKNSSVTAAYTNTSVTVSSKTNLNLLANIDYSGNKIKNSEQYVLATVTNNSSELGFLGTIYLFASTTTTKGSAKTSLPVNIGKNDKVVLELPFTPTAAGTYNIWISTDSNGSNVIGKSTLKIVSATAGSLTLSPAYSISNIESSTRYVWGNTLSMKFTGITNNTSYPIHDSFTVWLRQYDTTSATTYNSSRYTSYSDNAEYYNIDVDVPAKSSIEIPLEFEGLKYNTKYDVTLVHNGSTIRKVSAFTIMPGVTTWKANGTRTSVKPTSSVTIGSDVIAVDITDASTVTKITPNSNPNILYYLGASQKVPTGISGKNVVKGDVAESVTLVDNKDFFVPRRFIAKKINFTLIPTEGTGDGNNNHWNTIALPFDVNSVKNTTDDVDIDWFHYNGDTGKNFWIKKFAKLNTSDNTVIFEDADKMLAYEPYIMSVPDGYWGKKWDLRNKKITFYGENAVLHHEADIASNSSFYNFVGTTVKKTITNGWLLNDEGDTFKYYISNYKGTDNIVSPFHAYFVLTKEYFESSASAAKASLRIKFEDGDDSTTGIMTPFAAEEKQVNVYNINGVKVATKSLQNGSIDMSDLPKGIYVINGKKFIQY